ncbi:16S rRNA (cytosine(1402)-N(4))-methyltransferase RsmH [Candidatus Falkowbacteria bacterium]|nr:16S rRNA (cytosine(1402)-N(4))-methyltransferase RsmH [Candidatus Falkowbacteria bacterium]
MSLQHKPVLLEETIKYLDPKSGENFIDCTLGGGGHARIILEKTASSGKLLAIDLDIKAIEIAKEDLKEFSSRVIYINDNFSNLENIAKVSGLNKFEGILLDLGLSSIELDDPNRGFSFKKNAFLDMRFGSGGKTASDVLNTYKESELARIFKEYGEERYSKQIAKEIVSFRGKEKITTTSQLVSIIELVYKNKPRPKIHIATKVFQALRIEVNDELNNLKKVLPIASNLLNKGGRIVVISFHSLEDRIVKEYFKQESRDCLCPPNVPVCRCNHKASLKILTKKIIQPSEQEIKYNPRSRSAKLRAAQKI